MHHDPNSAPDRTRAPRKPIRASLLKPLRSGVAAGLALLLPSMGFLACDPSPPDSESRSPAAPLATLDGTPISASTIDAPLLLDLHDLDQAKYKLRRDRLLQLISRRLGPTVPPDSAEWSRRVELHLEPPLPPRLTIPDGSAPIRGPKAAPITIVELLDFESPHARRLQPDLLRMLERYPDRVRLLTRDMPLPYHRFARDAATAAHCAGEQGRYWPYHDMLLLEQASLAKADLTRYAMRLVLDPDAFASCTRSGRHEARIDADLALAGTLGVRRAATLFVNGLYLSGHPSFEEIDRFVREELIRMGLDSSPVARGAAVAPNESGTKPPSGRDAMRQEANAPSNIPKIPPGTLAEPEAVITLSRAEVDRALEDRRSLDRKLEASTAEFSGERLLKIRRVDQADFYTRLGLKERDVLLVVNGAFVTVEGTSIWDAFASGDTVTLLVMRRGLPHTYEYRIR